MGTSQYHRTHKKTTRAFTACWQRGTVFHLGLFVHYSMIIETHLHRITQTVVTAEQVSEADKTFASQHRGCDFPSQTSTISDGDDSPIAKLLWRICAIYKLQLVQLMVPSLRYTSIGVAVLFIPNSVKIFYFSKLALLIVTVNFCS